MIIFGSVRFLSKKVTKQKNFKKKQNRTETGSNRPVSVRFGFLGPKPVQIGLTWFFRFGLILARLGSFFPVWLGFGLVWLGFGLVFLVLLAFLSVWLGFLTVFLSLGSVRFVFFCFRLIKPKPNRTGWFFQNFNRFFFTIWFFRLFVFWFFGFFAHP